MVVSFCDSGVVGGAGGGRGGGAVVIVVVVVVVSQPLVRLPGEGGDSIHCTSGSKWIL